ncbi:MAG: ABC transporter substrate-binding protein [Actinomycetota bacterium]
MRSARALSAVLVLGLLAAGCASSEARSRGSDGVLRLGVFPTLTHAPAHVAVADGIFERVLGPTRVEVTAFGSGTEAGVALLSGAIDATYIGPWPTASLFLRSGRIAVVSGVAAGGASLVVRTNAGIDGPQDLHDRRIAVPGVSNTQDIALRTWLHDHDLRARDEGGDVAIVGLAGPEVLPLFDHDRIDGAWVPEPYPSLLLERGVGERLVDESDLWPAGELLSTSLVVSTGYLDQHPDVVRALVEANVEAILLCREDPDRARARARARLVALGGPELDDEVLATAWSELTFTWDPLVASFALVAEHAYRVGLLDDPPGDLDGMYRLDALNGVLNDGSLPPVEVAP